MATTRTHRTFAAIVLATSLPLMSGCTVVGAGVGALFGQALGGNTRSTVAGAAVGAAIGAQVDAAHAHYYYYQPPVYTVHIDSDYGVYAGECGEP